MDSGVELLRAVARALDAVGLAPGGDMESAVDVVTALKQEGYVVTQAMNSVSPGEE